MQRQNVRRVREAPSLPSDFPSQLLAAEFDLEHACTLEAIHKLIELYQTAIEFHELKGDSRFKDFKLRMKRMFERSDVQQKLNPPSKTQSNSPQKAKNPKLRSALAQSPPCVLRTDHLLDQQKTTSLQAGHLAKKDVEEQHTALKRRLAQRKLNKSSMIPAQDLSCNAVEEETEGSAQFSFLEEMEKEETKERLKARPLPTPPSRAVAESDKSGGPTQRLACNIAQKREEITARFQSDRLSKETELRQKYESQIAELEQEGRGSDLVVRIIATMRQEMNRELEAVRKGAAAQLHSALQALDLR